MDIIRELVNKKLNLTKIAIMVYLLSRGSVTFKELYEDLGLTPGNAWSHLEKLRKEGLVNIKKELGEGRPRVVVELTQKGLNEVESLLEVFDILSKFREFLPGAGEGPEGSE
ncbi:TPA: ArsR family transcriptional regulator [Desulfurococcaceae archaeon]|nr:ArsR family transcriptional regulator [Desulfurococcaceae archaeon]